MTRRDIDKYLDMYYRLTGKVRREVDKDLFETLEEVFDSATILAVLNLVRKGVLYELKGVVSAGKEARVYWGVNPEGKDLAVKIYLTSTAEFRRGLIRYIRGDPRFEGGIPRSTRKLMTLWARKEFRNYKLMHEAGVSVPKPITQHENILVMEFIGEKGIRAPLLKEVSLSEDEYRELFWNLLEDVKKMYNKAQLVHGDLSEYNVMIWQGKYYIIDVSQAVKINHPNALEFLMRDLNNLYRYFARELGLSDIPSVSEMLKYVAS